MFQALCYLCRRHRPSRAFCSAALAAAAPHLASLPERHLASLTWALAALRLRPSAAWMTAYFSATSSRLATMRQANRHMAIIMAALVAGGVAPPAAWLDAVYARLAGTLAASADAPSRHACSAQDVSNLLWAAAKLRRPPPAEFMTAACDAAQQRFGDMSGQQLANCLWALATLRWRPTDDWVRAYTRAVLKKAGEQLAARQSASDEYDGFTNDEPCAWASSGDAAAAAQGADDPRSPRPRRPTPQLTAQHLSNILWALARCGVRCSPRWLGLMADALAVALDDSLFVPQHVANAVWALPQLVAPELHRLLGASVAGPLARLEVLSLQHMEAFRPAELAQLAIGFADIGHTPSPRWLAAHGQAAAGLGAPELGARGAERLAAALLILRVRGEARDSVEAATGAGQGWAMEQLSGMPAGAMGTTIGIAAR